MSLFQLKFPKNISARLPVSPSNPKGGFRFNWVNYVINYWRNELVHPQGLSDGTVDYFLHQNRGNIDEDAYDQALNALRDAMNNNHNQIENNNDYYYDVSKLPIYFIDKLFKDKIINNNNIPQMPTRVISNNNGQLYSSRVYESFSSRDWGKLMVSPINFDNWEYHTLYPSEESITTFYENWSQKNAEYLSAQIQQSGHLKEGIEKNCFVKISLQNARDTIFAAGTENLMSLCDFYESRAQDAHNFSYYGFIRMNKPIFKQASLPTANFEKLCKINNFVYNPFQKVEETISKIWQVLGQEFWEDKREKTSLLESEYNPQFFSAENILNNNLINQFKELINDQTSNYNDQKYQTTSNWIDIIKHLVSVPYYFLYKREIWRELGYANKQEFTNKSIEDIIKDFGLKQYDLPNHIVQKNQSATSASDIVTSNTIGNSNITNQLLPIYLISSLFFRSGYHRLPATLPETLLYDTEKYNKDNKQPNIFIDDNLEFQEYFLKNFDALLGQFPVSFKHKTEDDKGNVVENIIKFDNLAEATTEILGLLISIAKDADTSVAVGIKSMIELAKIGNLALTSVDISRANADYLGYKFKEIIRNITIPFNPNATSLQDFLQDSEMQITTFDNIDDNTLPKELKTLLVAAQIIKAALIQRKEFITGDAIREQKIKDQEKYDKEWEELLDKYDGTNTTSQNPTITNPFPNAKIKDRSKPSNSNT